MRKIFLLLLVTCLLAACDNNPLAKKDSKEENRDKDKDSNDDDEGGKKDRNDEDDDTKSNWTSKQRNKWLNECIDASGDAKGAKEICSCVLDKIEKKYPDARDAENASEEEGARLARECMNGAGKDDSDEDDENVKGDDDDNNSRGGSWSNLQRKQFIQGCATTARQVQGFTSQQANDYCDCMTRKVERKHSFQEASRLTSEDFQTEEWQNAAMDCRSRVD